MSLVVMKYQFPGAPSSVAGWLDQLYACGTKARTERVDVVHAQVQVQMPTFVHELHGWILRVHTLEVKAASAGAYARVEVGVPEIEFQAYPLGIEADTRVEICRAQLGCNGQYCHFGLSPANG
jgi:hypothetical protein